MGMLYAVLIILAGVLSLFLPYRIALAYAAVILWVGALVYLIFDTHDLLDLDQEAMLGAHSQATDSRQQADA